MLTNNLLKLILAGGSEWVMILLLILSVISVGIMIERGISYRRWRQRLDQLEASIEAPLLKGDLAAAMRALTSSGVPALATLSQAIEAERGREAAEKLTFSAIERQRLLLERRLTFLGTLGNNAPFIGLFGTVLGIIRAFRDLADAGARPNPSVVMGGISEALVATAIGLFVALPAVLMFNLYQRKVDQTLARSESVAQDVLALLPGEGASSEEA